jgi:phosphoribosylformylglycinamidine synthase
VEKIIELEWVELRFHQIQELLAPVIECDPTFKSRNAKTWRQMPFRIGRKWSNPIVSIHDHGAGGHLNCLSELVEDTGGLIDLDKLPVGRPYPRLKEIMVTSLKKEWDWWLVKRHAILYKIIADRALDVSSRWRNRWSPFYFRIKTTGAKPMDLLGRFLWKFTKVVMHDSTIDRKYTDLNYDNKILQPI